ncbi:MAG: TIGR01777 family oxidoreductase [Bacteroidetes bacterium]|jgi:hypothetical protein|nr:TIGR01777 family oxidoreductase [Bacteroidota bacterium]
MDIVVVGGSGFIGRALIEELLPHGHKIVLTTRHPERGHEYSRADVRIIRWDGRTAGALVRELEGSQAVVNLAGESIAARRWSSAQKERILRSRLDPAQALVETIMGSENGPRILVNASAVGYYGDVPEGEITEDSPPGRGFLAEVCNSVEKAVLDRGLSPLGPLGGGLRICLIRTGIALSPHAGALQKLLLPFRCFIGGPLGSGQQWMPWIHIADVVRSIRFLLEHPTAAGPFNLTAPNPVRMNEFARTLGRVLNRPSIIPAPGFALKLLLGEMAGPLLLEGQRAIPHRLQQLGYSFKFSILEEALLDLLRKE